jgi:hypothetical protein
MTKYKVVKYWSKFANTIDENEVYIVGKSIHQALIKRVSGESSKECIKTLVIYQPIVYRNIC